MSTAIDPHASASPPVRDGMNSGAPRRAARPVNVGLIVVAVLSLAVVGYAAVVYGPFDPDRSVLQLRNSTWHFGMLQAHIVTGAIALALGPFQFFQQIRSKHPRVHRWIGRTYLFAGVFPSGLMGIPVALLSVEGAWAAGGLLVGDIAWLVTGVIAYRAARQRRFDDHGKWITWNFCLTFAAVTFRVWLPLLIFAQVPFLQAWYDGDFGALFTVAYSTTTWLAFLPNIAIFVLAQRILRARRLTES